MPTNNEPPKDHSELCWWCKAIACAPLVICTECVAEGVTDDMLEAHLADPDRPLGEVYDEHNVWMATTGFMIDGAESVYR